MATFFPLYGDLQDYFFGAEINLSVFEVETGDVLLSGGSDRRIK